MIAIFVAFLAVASAAPHSSGFGYHMGSRTALSDNSGESFFNMKNFWRDMENEMHRIDEMMKQISTQFPFNDASAGVVDNKYVVTLSLTGFDEKDIVVKAREGFLKIQAVHQDESGNQKTYMVIRTLPSGVGASGKWSYEKNVLRISFPLTKKDSEESAEVPTVKPAEAHSREEMDKKNDEAFGKDADVGLDKNDFGETDKDEILTNEISTRNTVEATTYAVEFNNEVEFVPVKY